MVVVTEVAPTRKRKSELWKWIGTAARTKGIDAMAKLNGGEGNREKLAAAAG